MRKFLALIALFVVLGFAGGAEAHSVVRSTAQRVEATEASGAQFVSAAPKNVADQTEHKDRECCWDGLCFNSSHCHHCGGAAALLIPSATSMLVSLSHHRFGSLADTIPIFSLSYAIIDPPRA
jgi:hypothetical protein